MKVKTRVMAKVMARDGIWWEGQENQEKAGSRVFSKRKRPGIGPFQFFLLFL